jgi:phosphoribosylformylglycinamidine synthase subunit PurQ / glutaminase
MTPTKAMRFAILQFPASNCDQDCVHALRVLGAQAKLVWHKDTSLGEVDAVIVPGGFSYGDALRCGAIARFSPVMQAVSRFADNGGLVLGICNGFQILCEAGLLPGALIRNRDLRFHCEQVFLKTSNFETPFTSGIRRDGVPIRIPIAHGEGCYFADAPTLERLQAQRQILWQYCDARGAVTDAANPNGSVLNIAGIANERFNVAGLMPHPDRAVEEILGTEDGRSILNSMVSALESRRAAA